MLKLLLIEDEPEVAHATADKLLRRGHQVVTVRDGESGLALASSERFCVVILDTGLPGGLDGFDVARSMRERRIHTPIVMFTRLADTEAVVHALECGADDYVLKSADFRELEARLRAAARRRSLLDGGTIRYGPLEVQPTNRAAFRDGERLPLTPTEFSLLAVFAAVPGRTVTRPELLRAVWGIDFDPGTRMIDVHVANLRRKLEAGGYPRLIVTERGVGFRAVEPSEAEQPGPAPVS